MTTAEEYARWLCPRSRPCRKCQAEGRKLAAATPAPPGERHPRTSG